MCYSSALERIIFVGSYSSANVRPFRKSWPIFKISGQYNLSYCTITFFTIFTTLSGSSLSNFAADLVNLEVLNLSNNRLTNLSRVKLPRLLHLDISENRFSKWSVAPLPHCHVVNAAGNQLISISEIEFGSPRITILNLAENFLVETPARLRFLSILNCANNSIELLKTTSIFLNKVRNSLIHKTSDTI